MLGCCLFLGKGEKAGEEMNSELPRDCILPEIFANGEACEKVSGDTFTCAIYALF